MTAAKISIDYESDCTCAWWIGVTDPESGRSWSIHCGSVSGRAKGYSRIYEETQP